MSVHNGSKQIERQTTFDFPKSDLAAAHAAAWARAASAAQLPRDLLRRNLLEVREALDLTQKELAERMTNAGARMTHVTISEIERGGRRVSVDELVVFAAVLEKPIVRLLSPRPDDETKVRVTRSRLYRSVEFRNWLVYGDEWTPAARGAQLMMELAYCSKIVLDSRDDEQRKAAAKARLVELLEIVKTS